MHKEKSFAFSKIAQMAQNCSIWSPCLAGTKPRKWKEMKNNQGKKLGEKNQGYDIQRRKGHENRGTHPFKSTVKLVIVITSVSRVNLNSISCYCAMFLLLFKILCSIPAQNV